MKKIYHETVNKKIIDFLDFDQYFEDREKSFIEYSVDMNIDGFDFEVVVTIENGVIEKDHTYYGKRNGHITECTIMRHPGNGSYKTLQTLFDEWLNKFDDWLYNQQKKIEAIELTNQTLNEKR